MISLFKKYLVYFCILFVICYFGCDKEVTRPETELKSPRDYVWTVDSLQYPESIQINMVHLWGSSPNNIYAIGHCDSQGGMMFHYNGKEWKAVNLNSTATGNKAIFGIWGSGAHDIWVVGRRHEKRTDKIPYYNVTVPLVLHFDGDSWEHMPLPGDEEGCLLAVWGRSANDVWAAGDSGMVWHYDGQDWELDKLPNVFKVHSISGTHSDVLLSTRHTFIKGVESSNAYLDTIVCYVSRDDGWVEVDRQVFWENTYTPRLGFWYSNFDLDLTLSFNIEIFQWTGDGWASFYTGPDDLNDFTINGVHGTGENNIIAVGSPPQEMVMHYDGNTWEKLNLNIKQIDSISWFPDVWTDGRECFISGLGPGKTYIIHGK